MGGDTREDMRGAMILESARCQTVYLFYLTAKLLDKLWTMLLLMPRSRPVTRDPDLEHGVQI